MSVAGGSITLMPSDRAIARLFASQHGLITREQAMDRGLPLHRIDYLRKKRRWEPVHTGVYRLAGSPVTWLQGLLAACLAAGEGAIASHRAAARLWDLSVTGHHAEITIPISRHIRLCGVTVHRTLILDRRDRRMIERIPTTTVARTVVDLASVLALHELEAVLDEALTRRLVTVPALTRRLEAMGTNGRKGARTLAHLLGARPSNSRSPESPFEARLERVLRRSALPLPVRQFLVRLPSGRSVRLDFAYPEALLAVEADSYRFHSSLSAWSRDRVRHNELVALGWRVLPVTFADLRDDPANVTRQIAQCLAAVKGLER